MCCANTQTRSTSMPVVCHICTFTPLTLQILSHRGESVSSRLLAPFQGGFAGQSDVGSTRTADTRLLPTMAPRGPATSRLMPTATLLRPEEELRAFSSPWIPTPPPPSCIHQNNR